MRNLLFKENPTAYIRENRTEIMKEFERLNALFSKLSSETDFKKHRIYWEKSNSNSKQQRTVLMMADLLHV